MKNVQSNERNNLTFKAPLKIFKVKLQVPQPSIFNYEAVFSVIKTCLYTPMFE